MVGRVGEVLRLQAEPAPFAVNGTVLAFRPLLDAVAGVELDAGHVRQDVHAHAGGIAPCAGRGTEGAVVSAHRPVAVVSSHPLQGSAHAACALRRARIPPAVSAPSAGDVLISAAPLPRFLPALNKIR